MRYDTPLTVERTGETRAIEGLHECTSDGHGLQPGDSGVGLQQHHEIGQTLVHRLGVTGREAFGLSRADAVGHEHVKLSAFEAANQLVTVWNAAHFDALDRRCRAEKSGLASSTACLSFSNETMR